MTVDSVDLKLLRILVNNARTPLRKMAREVGLSNSGVRRRIQQLEHEGIIKQYSALVDPKKYGCAVLAFVTISAEPRGLKELSRVLGRRREVCELHRTSGGDYLAVKVRTKDVDELNRFVEEHINSSDSVKKISTLIVMETYKETLLNP
jgi:DNA-binding Lrp family transcriptional regulator